MTQDFIGFDKSLDSTLNTMQLEGFKQERDVICVLQRLLSSIWRTGCTSIKWKIRIRKRLE